jgi:uridine phosphorylase
MENIPSLHRIQYFFISLPGTFKYLAKVFVRMITKGELPRGLKDGDLIITKDGEILIFDSCDCPQDS